MCGLREIPKFPRYPDLAIGGEHISGDDSGQRGFTGSVAADQTNPVAFGNMEIGGGQQHAGSYTNFQPLRFNSHAYTVFLFLLVVE
jgi:hypothetical protein